MSPTASPEEVNAAYRVLAQIFHPDRYQDSPEEVRRASESRMKALNQAYHAAQNGLLAVRPPTQTALHNRPSRRAGPGGPGAQASAGVPWDDAVRGRAEQAVRAEKARQAREQASPQGNATARPRRPVGGPVLSGLGLARFTNNIICPKCGSVQWLPENWRERLDDTAFYCSICDRLIFTR
ncbi:MAG: J domain-containing protein [Actinomycetota bacterium]|nr:J domain-containing protein [Actinomycetota bacterium]